MPARSTVMADADQFWPRAELKRQSFISFYFIFIATPLSFLAFCFDMDSGVLMRFYDTTLPALAASASISPLPSRRRYYASYRGTLLARLQRRLLAAEVDATPASILFAARPHYWLTAPLHARLLGDDFS